MYPELREMYKANIEKYGDFLAEEFFREYGTPAAMQTIRQNDKQRMKKLFNLLDDIYEDGTNETQSLIAVTILGAMHTDPQLVENAKEYMSETLAQPVLAVVRYLNSPAGKRAEKKLENPPPYKPKRRRKKRECSARCLACEQPCIKMIQTTARMEALWSFLIWLIRTI